MVQLKRNNGMHKDGTGAVRNTATGQIQEHGEHWQLHKWDKYWVNMGVTAELGSLLRAASTAIPAALGPQEAAAIKGTISSLVAENCQLCHSKRPQHRTLP